MPSFRFGALMFALAIGFLANAEPVLAATPLSCPSPTDPASPRLPLHVYVPPLVSNGPYSIQNPGRITDIHVPTLRSAVHRALCAIQAQGIPVASLRFTVYALTDEAGARAHILQALRSQGAGNAQLQQLGRYVVDVVAAWHRARIVSEQLQIELARALTETSNLESVEPTAMVEPAELSSDGPGTSVHADGEPSPPQPRSFVVTATTRTHPVFSSQSGNSSPFGPIILNSYCCNSCGKSSDRPSEPVKIPSRPIPLGFLQFEALVGAAIGTQDYTRTKLYHELAWLSIGMRQPVHRFELGLRLNFHAGGHPVEFNDIAQEQLRLGVGASARGGITVLATQKANLTAGLEVGMLYMFRRIEQIDLPNIGDIDTKHVLAPQAGVWLRTDVPLPLRRLYFSGEAGLSLLPITTESLTAEDLTITLLGGVSYALR